MVVHCCGFIDLFIPDGLHTRAREEVREMISRSVIPSTRAKYESVELSWKNFRLEKFENVIDVFNCEGSELSMVLLVLDWMLWMEKEMCYSPGVIGKMLTGMGFLLNCYVVHAGAMKHPSISRAKAAIAPVQARNSGEDNKMGISLDMVQCLRETLWLSGNIDQQMTYIAIATGYNFTTRPGHITYMGPGVTDHRYRVGDITLESEDGSKLFSFLEWLNTIVEGVATVPIGIIILRIESSKSHGARSGGDGTLNFICPGNEFENQYFEDMIFWLQHCGLQGTPKPVKGETVSEGSLPVFQRPLFSRIHPVTKRFKKSISREISEALKTVAENIGLQRKSFSGKSLRIGGCTTAVASGANSDEILRATGHAGIETSRIYTRSTQHKSTSFGFGDTVGVQDIKRMTLKRHREEEIAK